MKTDFSHKHLIGALAASLCFALLSCGDAAEKLMGGISDSLLKDWDYSVAIIEPEDGSQVARPLTIRITGEEIDEIALLWNDEQEIAREEFFGKDILLTYDKIPVGKHKFTAIGYDIDGEEQDRDSVTVFVVDKGGGGGGGGVSDDDDDSGGGGGTKDDDDSATDDDDNNDDNGQSDDDDDIPKDFITIKTPKNGDNAVNPVVFIVEASKNIATAQFFAGGKKKGELFDPRAAAIQTIKLDTGAVTVKLEGYSSGGALLASDEVAITVLSEGASAVQIISPLDGDKVKNPVTFEVAAFGDVRTVELFADEWSLGKAFDPYVQPTYTYRFVNTGYDRHIVLKGYDASGKTIAEHDITISVYSHIPGSEEEFNKYVVDMLQSYPRDGTHGYYWPQSGSWGTTRDIIYRGVKVADGDPQGRCYCSGITWETFMRAFQIWSEDNQGDGVINGMTVQQLNAFRLIWYVATSDYSGPEGAMEDYGIGDRVDRFEENAQPGDFVQLWRHNGSGHAVIFIDWVYDNSGIIKGLEYWSTQTSTNGINFNIENFGDTTGVDYKQFYIGRIRHPDDFEPFN